MKDHEIILKMIEEVSPDDTKTLDEIELLFWKWKLDLKPYSTGFSTLYEYDKEKIIDEYVIHGFEVTRSRDALKSIRPEGFMLVDTIQDWQVEGGNAVFCWSVTIGERKLSCAFDFSSPALKTEELAELHAIIQAIAYERGASHE